MHVPVLARTARAGRPARVAHIDHVQTPGARKTACRADGVDHLRRLVRDDVVGRAEAGEPGGQIRPGVEDDRPLRRDGQELWVRQSLIALRLGTFITLRMSKTWRPWPAASDPM